MCIQALRYGFERIANSFQGFFAAFSWLVVAIVFCEVHHHHELGLRLLPLAAFGRMGARAGPVGLVFFQDGALSSDCNAAPRRLVRWWEYALLFRNGRRAMTQHAWALAMRLEVPRGKVTSRKEPSRECAL